MTPNPFERPGKSQPSQSATNRPNPATQKSSSSQQKKVITVGGDRPRGGGDGGGGGGGGNPGEPSPWLDPEREPHPDKTASFVEYLRWMRSPDSQYKDPTKVQILQMAEENAKNYQKRLQQLVDRTSAIAGEGNTFQVKTSWRIRVGGHRGPESILLPAFDALGMPYIPSSTLRGAARTQAIREFMKQDGLDWKEAEKKVAPWFGSLETKTPGDRAGKVVFLDAYPLPNQAGLTVDMANNIWIWEDNSPKYRPKPNSFLSLKEATFLIGLRLVSGCEDETILPRVRQWLIAGLQSGIGSQVNSGYGELLRAGAGRPTHEFFRIEFSLQGQLIHGRQKFTNVSQPYQKNHDGSFKTDRNGKLKPDTTSDAEVRPVAFKSMLRYWFRTLALGVLPALNVRDWETTLFGGINPKKYGWLQVEILDGKVTQKEPRSNFQGKDDDCGEQEGVLTLSYSPEAPKNKQTVMASLCKNLTWMMFHLGGIGQGARRPRYSRKTRDRAPWYRGSTLYPHSDDSFWKLPATPEEFQRLFQQRLQQFYESLSQLIQITVNFRTPQALGQVRSDRWEEAVDANCRIVACAGNGKFEKSYALAVLHSPELKVRDRGGQENYDGNLCGQVQGGVKSSPVWIADLGDYQVVTVFGATQEDPRQNYLKLLRQEADSYKPIWPFS